MNETDKFLLVNCKNKLILDFNTEKFKNKQLYLPNCKSLDSVNRQIAIETNMIRTIQSTLNNQNIEITDKDIIDKGEITIIKQSKYKISFKLIGKYIDQMFVMIAPSWGRWTTNHIWLMISAGE